MTHPADQTSCPDPIERGHEAALGQAQQDIRRLGLMVDEYGAGASALTDKLKRARDMHRETCPLAQGVILPSVATCSLCEVLDAPAPLVSSPPADRAAVSAALWAAAEHHTVAEWICCDPIDPAHALCVQGGAALRMLKALLVDDPDAWKPAPLLDEVMRLVPPAGSAAEAHRLAASQALDLGTGAPWEAIHDRVKELRRMADEQPAEARRRCAHVDIVYGRCVRYLDDHDGECVHENQPPTVLHAVPLPGSNGISACCGRPPCEFVGERVTRNPEEVTCTGPAAVAGQDGAQESDSYEATTGHLITCLAVAGGTPDQDCPCTKTQDEAQQEADRIVGYRTGASNGLHCIGCTPSPRGDIWESVTSDDLPDGGVCVGCGVDVLIPQEASRG